jgi:tyrosine-protein phosphatase SIW14
MTMRRYVPYVLGSLLAAIIAGGPLAFALYYKSNYRNLRVVREGVLYRSGQLSLPALKRVVHEYGLRTIISMRDGTHPGEPPPDLAEEKYCANQNIRYLRIASCPGFWDWKNGNAPAMEGVGRFRTIMDDPQNYPVLIHCWGGVHRSGAFSAVYRMEYEHWSNDRAIAELRALGYKNIDDEWDILGFLQHFRPRWVKGGG